MSVSCFVWGRFSNIGLFFPVNSFNKGMRAARVHQWAEVQWKLCRAERNWRFAWYSNSLWIHQYEQHPSYFKGPISCYFSCFKCVLWDSVTRSGILFQKMYQMYVSALSYLLKATLWNFDCDPWLRKTKLCMIICRTNSNISKTRSYFMEKMSTGFYFNVLWLLCLSSGFY